MLKLWKKQAWREETGRNSVRSGEDDKPPPPSGTGHDSPHLDAAVAVPLHTGVSSPPFATARAQLTISKRNSTTESPKPPRKRTRTCSKSGTADALEKGPDDLVIFYAPPAIPTGHLLTTALQTSGTIPKVCQQLHQSAGIIASVLGRSASDRFWLRMLRNNNLPAGISQVRKTIEDWDYPEVDLDMPGGNGNVSSKVSKLLMVLHAYGAFGDGFRCIIFVRKRLIAESLGDLLDNARVGDCVTRVEVLGSSRRGIRVCHEEAFAKFSAGDINVLIATGSCEDLDIPKAKVIVCFDLFDSHLSHVYTHSHTQGEGCQVIRLAEAGNDVDRRTLLSSTPSDAELQAWATRCATKREGEVPPPSLHEGNLLESDEEDESESEFLEEPVTGARIYPSDSIRVIHRAVAAGASTEEVGRELFNFKHLKGESASAVLACSVRLPSALGGSVSGVLHNTVVEARRSACMAACRELFSKNLLDYRFFPRPIDNSFYDNQLLAMKPCATTTNFYLRKKSNFWQACVASVTSSANANGTPSSGILLYPTVVVIEPLDGMRLAPITILTRLPLPAMGAFNLFVSGRPAPIRTYVGVPFTLSLEHLQYLRRYTVRVCRVLKNTRFVCELDRMPYFLAPLTTSWEGAISGIGDRVPVEEYLLWEEIKLATMTFAVPVDLANLARDMEDAVIQDKTLEFTRRYYVLRVRNDLNPLSQPQPGSRESAYASFKDYVEERSKRTGQLTDLNQPLLEVCVVPTSLSHLSPSEKLHIESSHLAAKFLIPQLCMKVVISASALRAFIFLPSIMRRFDDLMIVKELNAKFFAHSIIEHHLHAAITPPSVCMEFDYERLELLGDAYLKYLYSSYLFVTDSAQREGALHQARLKVISNKALLANAKLAGLPQYIQARSFSYKGWKPPFFEALPDLPGTKSVTTSTEISSEQSAPEQQARQAEQDIYHKHAQEDPVASEVFAAAEDPSLNAPAIAVPSPTEAKPARKKKTRRGGLKFRGADAQSIGDKAIADVVEAILGAAYVSGGESVALQAAKALFLPLPLIDRWTELTRRLLVPPVSISDGLKLRPGTRTAVERIVGCTFAYPHLLAQALTHGSLPGASMTSYERLEFLGDAVLDFLVIRYLWNRDKELHPGGLTMLKGAMVSNSALAAACVTCGLYEHLHHGSPSVHASITTYAATLAERRASEYAAATTEARSPGQYWVDLDNPKVLSDVIEAVIGALYVSAGFTLAGPEVFFEQTLRPFFDAHISLRTVAHHPTKILFELLQGQGCQLFGLVKHTEPGDDGTVACDVIVHDVVLARGMDTTGAKAARTASLQALDALEGDAGFMRRTCYCHAIALARKDQRKELERFADFGDEEQEMQSALAD